MNFSYLKSIVIALTIGCFPVAYATNADTQSSEANKGGESFQTVCINTWMKRAEDAKDKVDYKNFGEKYCGCAATQPLDSDAAINKAIQLCMSRTLLHDAMDSLEDEVGLSEAKESDVDEYCQDRWNLIYPKLSDAGKKATMAYCACAKPKLMVLIKESDNMTDKQYEDGINAIAADCSGQVADEKGAGSSSGTTNSPSTPATPTTTTPASPTPNSSDTSGTTH